MGLITRVDGCPASQENLDGVSSRGNDCMVESG